MDLKAFYKIYDEAEDAFAERRLLDAISLTFAIVIDIPYPDGAKVFMALRQRYKLLLQDIAKINNEENKSELFSLYVDAIELLQTVRSKWHEAHPEVLTYISPLKASASSDTLINLFHRLKAYEFGKDPYFNTLDEIFVLLQQTDKDTDSNLQLIGALHRSDCFARRTLVSALLLGILNCFSKQKLKLLLALCQPRLEDNEDECYDLLARCAVALTIISMRYESILPFYPKEWKVIRTFIASSALQDDLPVLLYAIVSQLAAPHIGEKLDDITPLIRETFEKQQPHLGSEFDEEENEQQQVEKNGLSFEVREIHIDKDGNERLFKQLQEHARQMEELREADLDINFANFIHMKRFDFFKHSAHWFYPFSNEIPIVRKLLKNDNGKTNQFLLSVMNTNRFCASDRYSYVCMVSSLQSQIGNKDSLFSEQFGRLEDNIQEMLDNHDSESADIEYLNPFSDYCQCLYRYFNQPNIKDIPHRPFSPDERRPLPMHPLFEGLLTDESAIVPCIQSLIILGDNKQAIALADYATSQFGSDANLLYARGIALMNMQQWKQAITIFQQVTLISDNYEAGLNMARCFEALYQWEQALPLLRKEEERLSKEADGDIVPIIEEIGRCLIELQRWDEAVQCFFRLEFMERRLNIARHAIAWCSIHQGKYERATNYYQQLIQSEKATWEDWLNNGHALWLQGRTDDAVNSYRQSKAEFNKAQKAQQRHFKHWEQAFQEDAHAILAPHFDDMECGLMMDAVCV